MEELSPLFHNLSSGEEACPSIERDNVIQITARATHKLFFWSGIVAFTSGFSNSWGSAASFQHGFLPWGNYPIGSFSVFFNNWRIVPSPAQAPFQASSAAIPLEAVCNRCTIFPLAAG
jgi:hypothetical protein